MSEPGAAGRRRVVVLDDDPTGTQAARDVTVLLTGDGRDLAEVLRRDRSAYVQTNSRSLTEPDAVRQAERLRTVVNEVGAAEDLDVRVVLRGDSTLRGHVFGESGVFLDDDSVLLFVPAFPDGGRLTRDGVHLVRQGGRDVPVGETEFARDPVFAFRSSSLPDFVRERTGSAAEHVDLAGLRAGGLPLALRRVAAGTVVVADCETGEDVRRIADDVREVWEERRVVVRCAAPLAAELAEVAGRADLPTSLLRSESGALVVCGSHTDLARAQLEHLERLVGPATVVDTVGALRDPEEEGRRIAAVERASARTGGVRLVATERDRDVAHASLADGAAVMRALTVSAALLVDEARVLVTKGGITASDVIAHSLGARRGTVRGQVRPGVSVWDVTTGAGRDVRCLIVPGNMGSEEILADAVRWIVGAD